MITTESFIESTTRRGDTGDFRVPSIDEFVARWLMADNTTVNRPNYVSSKQTLDVLSKTFAVTSIVANVFSLLAIGSVCRLSGAPTTNLRLICSLSAADILTGLCGALSDQHLTPINGFDPNPCVNLVIHKMRIAAHLLTLSSCMGLAVDHYLAICRPLFHLQQIVATSVNVAIAATWLIGIASSLSDVMVAAVMTIECPPDRQEPGTYEFCGSVKCMDYTSEYLVYPLAFVVLVTMLTLYAFTCRQIYHCRRLHQHNGHQFQRLMIRRTKKAMCTTLIVVGMFVACWLPYCFINAFIVLLGSLSSEHTELEAEQTLPLLTKLHILDRCFYVLLMFNGVVDPLVYDSVYDPLFIDPLVYAVRMRNVRQGYKQLGSLLFGKICRRCWINCVALLPLPRPTTSNPVTSSVTLNDASVQHQSHHCSLVVHRPLTTCCSDPTTMTSGNCRVAMTSAKRTLTATSHDRATSWIARRRRHGDSPKPMSTLLGGQHVLRLTASTFQQRSAVVEIELSDKRCPSPADL